VTHEQLSHWNSLRLRLRAATQQYGAKAELARQFNITPQAVAEWLSGASAPTADTTLRLLEWVTTAEADQQKKRAGSARTQPALKTRDQKSRTNEKPKTSPEKR